MKKATSEKRSLCKEPLGLPSPLRRLGPWQPAVPGAVLRCEPGGPTDGLRGPPFQRGVQVGVQGSQRTTFYFDRPKWVWVKIKDPTGKPQVLVLGSID